MKISLTNFNNEVIFKSENINNKDFHDILKEKLSLFKQDQWRKEYVYVCFFEWDDERTFSASILITENFNRIWNYAEYEGNLCMLDDDCIYQAHQFESFQDAFDFCKLLKEEC